MIIFNSVKLSNIYSFGTRKTCIIKRRQSQQIIKKKTPKFTFFLAFNKFTYKIRDKGANYIPQIYILCFMKYII